ncbi:hypothetical protein V0M98_32510 (plasmid) [Pseudomonas silesiensis]|uniref:hypothetical protein n=1 Tax=Pseudomonas silesiensis TaxID=1853130 RepID=UPI0030D5AAA1
MSQLMRTGVRYALTFNNAAKNMKYREHDQEQNPMDYYRLVGPHQSTLHILVNHRVMVVEAGVTANAQLEMTFDAARSGLFRDFCKEHLAAIELEGGKALMRFYDNEYAQKASFEVPFNIVQPGL